MEEKIKVLVTGGTGFVGERLRLVKPDWVYMSSKDVNFISYEDTLTFLKREAPDAIVHLAARVGGIQDNAKHPADFYDANILINTNVVRASKAAGIKRLLACLSTCAFPDEVEYPFDESSIMSGPPAETNLAYGFTKRALYVQIMAYRKQYGLDYSCFSPTNLYGPEDNFDPETSHFIPAALKKFREAKGEALEFWGTGDTIRQFLFIDDLCSALPELLDKHHDDTPVIISPDETINIQEMASLCKEVVGSNSSFSFNGYLPGQFRKDAVNDELKKLLPSFEFTPYKDGLRATYEWYEKSVNNGD